MKKNLTLSLLILMFCATNLFAVDKLLIVGDALFCGFNGKEAPFMYAEGNDVFTFTAWFDADKEFKFMQDSDWGGQFYNGAGATGYLDVALGGTLTDDGNIDAKFMFENAGYYKVICNLANLTITAEAKESNDEQPIRYQNLFMTGGATLTGWDLGKSLGLENQNDLSYSGDFYLNAGGTFKLSVAPNKGFDNNYFFFKDEQDAGKLSQDATDDRQWEVTESGLYNIVVDLTESTISYTKKDFDKLYAVGGAVFTGWSADNSPMLNSESANIFTYTAWFKADEEFKFITKRALTDNDIQIQNGTNETGYIEQGSATLKVALERMDSDHKFKLAEAGNYKITCDLNTMTITAEKIAYQETEIHYSALYLVGTATPDNEFAEDFPTKAVKLISKENNTYSVENIDLETGVFKILTANDCGWSTTHYFRDENDNTKISEDGTDDRKWEISEAGKYNITVDMNNMTISIEKQNSGPSTYNKVDSFINTEIYSANGQIYVNNAIGTTLRLYSVQGKLLNETRISAASQILAFNFNGNICIAVLSAGNESKAYKLNLK